ncbi:MAG TPA: TIGR03767 family metallophosphoesterase [Streptosporangiaceae bacterium]|nr:TIGR03767 family metallophosphoesterase [Streptosporangiaceae bacterium]
MSGHHPPLIPPLTTQRRLGPGAVLRPGSTAPYRAVTIIDGEPHAVRDDLGTSASTGASAAQGRPLLCLVHLTDLQLADVQSPTRFEFLNRHFADPRYADIIPVQRPQEALTVHAVDATLRTVNSLHGPATQMPLQLAVTTGDAIDNAQWNELQTFLALLDGGVVMANSGGPGHEGVQALDWPDDFFWKPDGHGPSGPDIFRREFGFPHHPGLLERALREFQAGGLRIPWLSCFGNHEALNQGVGAATTAIADALVGSSKPMALPDTFDHDQALELFTGRPEAFLAGPARTVTPDPGRRPITRRDFVDAHFRPGARPDGHGFTAQNLLDGTAYYVHDTPAVRLIALDTNCLAGGAAGCLDRQQARWLEARLAEVHSAYRGPDGHQVSTGHEDRLAIVFSHHGIDTLTNTRHTGPGGEPLFSGADLLALLHRFPNLVLWLNGHTHTNAVRPRRDPADPGRGFWEVTTCAIVDWPCQTRLVELVDAGEHLSIVCTMADHDSPLGPASLETGADLAALHRELAANVPFGGAGSGLAGATLDRNVELRLRPPFPLGRLASGTAGRLAGPQAGRAARAGGESLVEWPGAVARPELPGERPVGGPAPGLRL